MLLAPGVTQLDQAQVDYAQTVLRTLHPSGRIIAALGYDGLTEGDRPALARYATDLIGAMKASGESEEALVDVLLIGVRFDRTSSEAWNQAVFQMLLLPALRAFATKDMWWAVQRLCRLVGIVYFTGARDDAYVGAILSAMETALAPELARWPAQVAPPRSRPPSGKHLSIGLVTDFRLAELSGIHFLMRFLEAYHRRFPGQDRLYLVIESSALTEQSAPYRARVEAAGVTIVPYDRSATDPNTPIGFGDLATVCARLDLDVAVFFCSYSFALLAAWCRLAPVQAYWSVSFDAAPSRQIELLLSTVAAPDGASTHMVAGRQWVFAAPLFTVALKPVEPVRRDGPHGALGRPLFATVGGIQKVDNDDFMTMLARLLGEFPDAAFLWTDPTGYPHFDVRARRFGIAERCHNVGYVDVDAFAPEIDVHLDSFPYGTAEASLRMLARSCPTVSLVSKISLYGGIYNPLLANGFDDPQRQARARALFFPNGKPPRLLVADTIDRYVALAAAVVRDPEYRAACAAAYRDLFSDILRDGAYAAELWRRALLTAIDARPAG